MCWENEHKTCQQFKRRGDTRGISSHRCENTKEANIGHRCNCPMNRIKSNLLPKVDANRQTNRYMRIIYLFMGEQRSVDQASRRLEDIGREAYSFTCSRKVFGFGFQCNLPAMILLKRQRSTGLGRAGAIDCLRRCIVISGSRPGGDMIACCFDDVCVLFIIEYLQLRIAFGMVGMIYEPDRTGG